MKDESLVIQNPTNHKRIAKALANINCGVSIYLLYGDGLEEVKNEGCIGQLAPTSCSCKIRVEWTLARTESAYRKQGVESMERVDVPGAGLPVSRDGAADDEAAERTCILVLGMHRSGTSAVCGALARLGAMRPNRELPPAPDNPKGFFEPAEIVAIHDDMLRTTGTRWSDWDPLPGSFLDTKANRIFRKNLIRAIREDYTSGCPFLLKDPRICRFVALWTSIFKEIGVRPKVVNVFRHPLEVAHSLHTRNNMSVGHGLLLWLRYVLDSEYETRDLNRVFLEYSRLIKDYKKEFSRVISGLDLNLRDADDILRPETPSFVEQDLRHQNLDAREGEAMLELPLWVREAFSALRVLHSDPNATGAMRALDGIRRDFDIACHVFAPALGALPCDAGVSRFGERRNENIETELTELRKRLGSVQLAADRAAALEAELAEMRERLVSVQLAADRSAALEAELTVLRKELGETEGGDRPSTSN